MIDIDAFIDGYIATALWADCEPAVPTDCELVEHALMQGATREYVADADTDQLRADYLDSWRDTAESGGGEDLAMSDAGRERMSGDCIAFVTANADDLTAYCDQLGDWSGPTDSCGRDYYAASERAGGDFWFTRSGHGTGFWDRGLGALGERLSDAARVYGEGDRPFDCGDGTADVM